MKREDNGSTDHKNDETSQSILPNNSNLEVDNHDCKIFQTINLEEDNNSLSEIEDSKFIGFPVNSEEDEIEEKYLYFIKDEKNPTNQADNINQLKKFKVSRNPRGRKKNELLLNKKRKVKVHNKYSKDNLLRKCQISYFNFMIDFLNIFIRSFNTKLRLNPKKKFIPSDYDIKKTIKRTQKINMHTKAM